MYHPSDLCVYVPQIESVILMFFDINSWNWLSTFSKWDFVEMKYPVRDVAAFKSPPMILHRPSDVFISAWMWVFTRLWRSGRLPLAWWMLIMLIRSPSCVIAPSNQTSPWAMCSSAFFPRGLRQYPTSGLGRNTRVCRKVTTVICALPSSSDMSHTHTRPERHIRTYICRNTLCESWIDLMVLGTQGCRSSIHITTQVFFKWWRLRLQMTTPLTSKFGIFVLILRFLAIHNYCVRLIYE